jgi:hypothetical protein
MGATVRPKTIAAAAVIAVAFVVAVPSLAAGQEEPSEDSTTTTEATTTTTRPTPNTTDDVLPTPELPSLQECDPSYPTLCIPPESPDLDCEDLLETNFPVLPPDHHGFDGDHDGIGCESGDEVPPSAAPAQPVTEEPDFTG